MSNSKTSSLKLGRRKPYEPISRVLDLPPAILEVATLIEKGLAGDRAALEKAAALQESVIAVALEFPDCVGQIRNLLANGYTIEFSVSKEDEENLEMPEGVSLAAT